MARTINRLLSRITGYLVLLFGENHSLTRILERRKARHIEAIIKKSKWPEELTIDSSSLIRFIKDTRKDSGTCHIIASGGTALETASRVPQSDYTIGFNFSALLPVSFDLYFFEYCNANSRPNRDFSVLQATVIQSNKDIGRLVAKNIWENKLDFKYVKRLYESAPHLLKDIHLPYWTSKKSRRGSLVYASRLLSLENGYVRQASTTTLTCICMAINAGFKRVVVHGFDMSGPHFYTHPELAWPDKIKSDSKEWLIAASFRNSSAHPATGSSLILEALKTKALQRGCELLSATSRSPCSKIIGYLDQ